MAAKKSTAKKSPAKKSPAKKTTAKKSSAKRTTGAQKTARKAARASTGDNGSRESGRQAPRAAAPKRVTGVQIAGLAAQQLLELTGRDAEGVIGLERTDDGWKVQIEVVEVRRIPDTTDVLALYEVSVDEDGDLQSYRRLRRYARGVARED